MNLKLGPASFHQLPKLFLEGRAEFFLSKNIRQMKPGQNILVSMNHPSQS